MSAKFTDGERWIYQRDDGENGEIFYALHRASDYEFIANIYGDETRARLIAAVPDLLVDGCALAVAIDAICPSDPAIEHASVEWKRVHAALKKFRASVTKATLPSTGK